MSWKKNLRRIASKVAPTKMNTSKLHPDAKSNLHTSDKKRKKYNRLLNETTENFNKSDWKEQLQTRKVA